ncbi:MAG: endonuclease MutS2 [Candidatus Latescibacteria bacterium]|nr:endonuclease MutS2 [Candidatus Latescibacterota bacterium]
MDQRTFEILGFNRVIELIANKTQTEFGVEMANALKPETSIIELEKEFDLLQESMNLAEEIGLYGVTDLRPDLPASDSEIVLSPMRLRDALKILVTIRNTKDFFSKNRTKYPKIYQLVKILVINETLEKAINTAIDEYGEIKSDASPKLKKIRSEITKQRNSIINRLHKIIQNKSEYLQDSNFAIRHNRFCLPLKAEAQKKISGILHEFSPARKTVFIEPLELVDEQNDFARLLDEEKNEIQRILAALSKELYKIRDELFNAFTIIGQLDLLFAKRRFSLQFNCQRPIISNRNLLQINKGIHPLLKLTKTDIVPLELTVPQDAKIILISGPNAGGKTVVMKTVGLFVLMFLSGIYLPASPGTEIPFFTKVFADIGDEQSLDSNLSSFSAHIVRVKQILENADSDTLVLLDEIGSSTAPEEGSALAIAILEALRDNGVYCLATSHFNPLKAFVNDAQGMVNAAMEYSDRPTYRFTIGLPGTSSALEISKELGFPLSLIERAKNFLNQDWLSLSERINSLNQELGKNRILNEKIEKEKIGLSKIRAEYESKLNKFKKFENDERQKIQTEQRNYLLTQRRHIENLIRNIKESHAQKEAIVNAKHYVQDQLSKITNQQYSARSETDVTELYLDIGDTVFSKTFQKTGRIVEINKKVVTVAFGSIKFEINNQDLEKVEDKLTPSTSHQNILQDTEPPYFEPLLNIRGLTKEEAEIALQQFLNQAADNNLNEVSIIHGKGKGILKDMLWNYLQHDTRIERFCFGESYEGGDGVTKVILKK